MRSDLRHRRTAVADPVVLELLDHALGDLCDQLRRNMVRRLCLIERRHDRFVDRDLRPEPGVILHAGVVPHAGCVG